MKPKPTKPKSTKSKIAEPVMVQCLLDPKNEADQEIIGAIEHWNPTFERMDLGPSDLIFAMLHHSATNDEQFENYLSGFLSSKRDPNWRFDPWTGELIE